MCFVVFMHPILSSRSIRFFVFLVFIFRSCEIFFLSSVFRMCGSATLHTEASLAPATCKMYIYISAKRKCSFGVRDKNCTDNANFTIQTSWEWRSSGASKNENTKPAWCMKTLLGYTKNFSYFASGKYVQFLALFSHKASTRFSRHICAGFCAKWMDRTEERRKRTHGIDLQARQTHEFIFGQTT